MPRSPAPDTPTPDAPSRPQVSILIRSIDRSDLLRQALDSVARQTWPAIEVVVIAAKPDHRPLPATCGAFPLRLIATDSPLHRSRAANCALEEAQGDLLLFLDDDDWLLPGHVEKLAQALEQHPDALVAYSDVQPVNAEGEIRGEPFAMPFDPLRLLAGNWMPPQAVMFRRALIDRGCRFDESLDLYEDWDFWLQASAFTTFVHVQGVSACYRIHDSSGVHEQPPFTGPASLTLYHKWRSRWSDAQLGALMARVWSQPELAQQVQQLRDEAVAVHGLLATERADLARTQGELARTQGELAHVQDSLAAQQRRIAELLASTSWRFTAPLRGLSRLLRTTRELARRVQRAVMQPRWGWWALRHALNIITTRGWRALLADFSSRQNAIPTPDYCLWIARYEIPADQHQAMQQLTRNWQRTPVISVIMPTYNSNLSWLQASLDSVRAQVYPHWELCIADDASDSLEVHALLERHAAEDSRIRWLKRPVNGHISAASNSALTLAQGEFVALLDHDDLLHPLALWFMAQAIDTHPDAGLLYSDEDKLDLQGQRCDPYFKCEYNPELMLGQNMVSHLGCYRRDLVTRVGGFREGLEGSQDYDLALRVIEQLEPHQIVHVPRVLYHWRIIPGSTALSANEKPYAQVSAKRAVTEHLQRRGITAELLPCPEAPHLHRVRLARPDPLPLVSIIIPTRDRAQLLETCVESIRRLSSYPHFEIIVVDNGSIEPATQVLFERLQQEGVILLRDEHAFNFSALNNRAARRAKGEILCLMNNDIEILTPDWLEEMASFAVLPEVGAVGARLWYPDGTLQHAGVILGLGGVAGHPHSRLPRGHTGYFGRAVLHQSLSAVTAACLVIRKSVFDEVGGLDETLAIAFNDVDFCLRVRAAGYRNVWTPAAEMIHHESASRGTEDTPAKQRRFFGEVATMQERWADIIQDDPAYSPNLTLSSGDFAMAQPPRVPAVIATQARP